MDGTAMVVSRHSTNITLGALETAETTHPDTDVSHALNLEKACIWKSQYFGGIQQALLVGKDPFLVLRYRYHLLS